jgi:hypothetical protein
MFVDFPIVVRTFRRPRELIEAVSSVLRQVGATIEVFIDDSPEEAVGQSATNVSPI